MLKMLTHIAFAMYYVRKNMIIKKFVETDREDSELLISHEEVVMLS